MSDPLQADALAQVAEDFVELFEHAPCGYVSAEPGGRITKVNLTMAAWLQSSPAELVGRRFQDLLNVAGKIYYETHFAPLLRMQGFFNEVALDLVTATGAPLPVLVNATERRSQAGEVEFIRITVFNATDRRRYEQELLEARRRADQAQSDLARLNAVLEQRIAAALAERKVLADLVESTDAFVQAADLEFRWLAINKAAANEFERIFGVRPEVGACMLDLLEHLPGEQTAVRDVWARALGGEEFTEVSSFGDPGRERRHYEMKYNVLRDAAGRQIGAYQFVRDVTERVREQERLAEARESLRHAQKMEAIGQLTGGVAHDFNNLLTVILGGLETITRHATPEPPAAAVQRIQRSAAMATHAAERAATLTSRLLAFSRRQPLDPRAIDIARLVTGLSDLLQRTLGETIELETVAGAGLWRTLVDPGELENALVNLAVNARDAMPGGGRLTIETTNAYLDEQYLAAIAEPVEPGQYVLVAVSDTGDGMDEATAGHAFEPFFTTKDVGKGTGLGLSQVYGFIRQSGGHVRIYSELGHGTTVKMYLPRVCSEISMTAGEPPAQTSPPHGGAETILVVEDHDDLRAFSTEVLTELGYRVLSASNAATALNILDSEPSVELLFTDVVLPEQMDGRQLADEAQRRWPDLKVLFTTGYTRNAIVHNGRLDAGVRLLNKPFSAAALGERVRSVLDEREETLTSR